MSIEFIQSLVDPGRQVGGGTLPWQRTVFTGSDCGRRTPRSDFTIRRGPIMTIRVAIGIENTEAADVARIARYRKQSIEIE